jgi:hypothetical protein
MDILHYVFFTKMYSQEDVDLHYVVRDTNIWLFFSTELPGIN